MSPRSTFGGKSGFSIVGKKRGIKATALGLSTLAVVAMVCMFATNDTSLSLEHQSNSLIQMDDFHNLGRRVLFEVHDQDDIDNTIDTTVYGSSKQ